LNDTKTTITAKPQKTGGKRFEELLECVKALKEMGALSVSISNDKIDATFPQLQPLHVEPIKPKEQKPIETILGYPKRLLMHSTEEEV